MTISRLFFVTKYIILVQQVSLDIQWPEVIRNEDFWARTEQERINIQIRMHTWGWIGHTLRKPNSNVTRHALRWNPQGKRKQGHPRNRRRRTMDNGAAKAGYTWKEIETLAQNRRRWLAVPWTYAPQGMKGNKIKSCKSS